MGCANAEWISIDMNNCMYIIKQGLKQFWAALSFWWNSSNGKYWKVQLWIHTVSLWWRGNACLCDVHGGLLGNTNHMCSYNSSDSGANYGVRTFVSVIVESIMLQDVHFAHRACSFFQEPLIYTTFVELVFAGQHSDYVLNPIYQKMIKRYI